MKQQVFEVKHAEKQTKDMHGDLKVFETSLVDFVYSLISFMSGFSFHCSLECCGWDWFFLTIDSDTHLGAYLRPFIDRVVCFDTF